MADRQWSEGLPVAVAVQRGVPGKLDGRVLRSSQLLGGKVGLVPSGEKVRYAGE